MFRRQSYAIFRELTVPDQIYYTNVMDAKTGDSERTPTLIHDVSATDLIRNCELPDDGQK
jgi:hypothetical protein